MTGDTGSIFALATARTPAALAIIRLSGPMVPEVLTVLTKRSHWPPRLATKVRLHAANGDVLDESLAVLFPRPKSFTGEDMAELHIHGGRATVDAVLAALAAFPQLRPAEPGEFSRRAFMNGKVDLTQAEAIADLIAAETALQRQQALRQLSGTLGHVYERWREQLLEAAVRLEAAIDFSDEDLPAEIEAEAVELVAQIRREMDTLLTQGRWGERIREGFTVVLLGAPNAGKSTLLNALCGREAAITDAAPGTTRDVVEVLVDIHGLPVTLCDTAGLRQTESRVEQEGVMRAMRRAEEADLKILVMDGLEWPHVPAATLGETHGDFLGVLTKSDVAAPRMRGEGRAWEPILISAKTGEGLAELTERIAKYLGTAAVGSAEPVMTRVRHRDSVERARQALTRFEMCTAAELAAEELRVAMDALGRITGRVAVNDVLDGVFRSFCIGK